MLECVVNISEGRDAVTLAALEASLDGALLDLHRDPHHNRSVFTLIGEDAPRRLASRAVDLLDIRSHSGVHPRIGVVDVVPFVPLGDSPMSEAVAARDRFAEWFADEHGVPSYLYGPERTLPDVRRGAWTSLTPDFGGATPHPTAGAAAVGARGVLVAYNLWLAHPDMIAARDVARRMRGPAVRTLALQVGARVQLSMNLVQPDRVGPLEVERQARQMLRAMDNDVAGAELVGLVPQAVLDAIEADAWERLDLGADRTIEARLRSLLRR